MAALTLKCIKHQVKVPDGILLCYPALDLNRKKFTPLFLISLEDLIVPHTFFKLCTEAYIPDYVDPNIDPFISTLIASDELLKKFPPTAIM